MHRNATCAPARHREDGFSLLELVIALVVLAIIMAIAINAFGGAKKATYANEGKTVGSAYMQAVSQYHADFANRHPPNGAASWTYGAPTRGPLNLTGQPYMKSIPDAVTAGRVGVSVSAGGANCSTSPAPATPSGAGAQTSWVAVCLGAEPNFFVKVFSHKASGAPWDAANGGAVCFMGDTTAVPRC